MALRSNWMRLSEGLGLQLTAVQARISALATGLPCARRPHLHPDNRWRRPDAESGVQRSTPSDGISDVGGILPDTEEQGGLAPPQEVDAAEVQAGDSRAGTVVRGRKPIVSKAGNRTQRA
jgi:hypothetical protein